MKPPTPIASWRKENPAAEPALPAAHSSLPFNRIGPYRLIERLGEGGLAEVYLSIQEEPFRRKVALKLVKSDMNTPEVAARFRSEIRAIGVLDHPNIAGRWTPGHCPRAGRIA